MSFLDAFRPRASPAPRTSCPFCPGQAAATPSKPLCNVCRREASLREVGP